MTYDNGGYRRLYARQQIGFPSRVNILNCFFPSLMFYKWDIGNKAMDQYIEGLIACYELNDWWLSTFTLEEQKYIDERYNPMGAPPHMLTRGKFNSSKPVTTFLNELNTWFRSRKDESISQRIHNKIRELGEERSDQGPGYYQGRHYTTWVSDVEELKKAGQFEEAKELLLGLIDAVEEQSRVDGLVVAPWYYDKLAILYRKEKDFSSEIKILDRYSRQNHHLGKKSLKLLERLSQVKTKLANSK